ncbi:MAG: hypothetical protein IJZ66_05435 [Oscillibacter sp.]|nr:hypothetical protein [Oscillibacter sp.]MBQ8851865.1 hypothetical protein [Oscillibacter sp.]
MNEIKKATIPQELDDDALDTVTGGIAGVGRKIICKYCAQVFPVDGSGVYICPHCKRTWSAGTDRL